MVILVYMWFKDDGGVDIKGLVMVQDCEGSVEFVVFDYGVYILIDGNIGKLMGMCVYKLIMLMKEIDVLMFYLYKVVMSGQMFKLVEIKWYKIDDVGKEKEYFNMKFDNVKIVVVNLVMYDIKNLDYEKYNYFENVEFCYEMIMWLYKDGNIIYKDIWNEWF